MRLFLGKFAIGDIKKKQYINANFSYLSLNKIKLSLIKEDFIFEKERKNLQTTNAPNNEPIRNVESWHIIVAL